VIGALIAVVGLGVISSATTLGVVAQPPPGEGTVYVTKTERAPDGAILKPLDLKLGLFTTVVRDLGSPHDVICGPDGRLYFNDLWQQSGNRRVNRIWRFNQDGSGRSLVARWDSENLRPDAMVLAPNGDLYFGTVSTDGGNLTRGIWRIPDALQLGRQFSSPEQILPPQIFTPPPCSRCGAAVNPYAILTTGPFEGDLLLIDDPWWWSSTGAQGEHPGDRVLQALAPAFSSVEEFIPRNDPETGERFFASSLAINSQGDVLVAGGTASSHGILRYGSDGAFKGVFAEVSANQIAVGPDDYVYVANAVFSPTRGVMRGSLIILDPDGNQVESAEFPLHLRGVTVCRR
jgi:hypothetical protein